MLASGAVPWEGSPRCRPALRVAAAWREMEAERGEGEGEVDEASLTTRPWPVGGSVLFAVGDMVVSDWRVCTCGLVMGVTRSGMSCVWFSGGEEKKRAGEAAESEPLPFVPDIGDGRGGLEVARGRQPGHDRLIELAWRVLQALWHGRGSR